MFDLASFLFGLVVGVSGSYLALRIYKYYYIKRYQKLMEDFMDQLKAAAEGEGIAVINLEDDGPTDRSIH